LVSGGNAAEVFDFLEETLNEVAFFVDVLVIRPRLFAVASWWDNSCCAGNLNGFNEVIGIITLIGNNIVHIEAFDEGVCLTIFRRLPGG
jgi:hypothetical protein